MVNYGWCQRLKLKLDGRLSNFALYVKLCRYLKGDVPNLKVLLNSLVARGLLVWSSRQTPLNSHGHITNYLSQSQ